MPFRWQLLSKKFTSQWIFFETRLATISSLLAQFMGHMGFWTNFVNVTFAIYFENDTDISITNSIDMCLIVADLVSEKLQYHLQTPEKVCTC